MYVLIHYLHDMSLDLFFAGSSNPPPPESVASLAVSTTTTSSGTYVLGLPQEKK